MVAKNCTFWFHIWQHWDIHRLDFLLEFESFASLRDISSLSPKSVNWDKLTVLYILFLKGFLPEHILIGFTQCEESDSLDSLSKGLRHLHHDRHSSFKVFLTPCTSSFLSSSPSSSTLYHVCRQLCHCSRGPGGRKQPKVWIQCKWRFGNPTAFG